MSAPNRQVEGVHVCPEQGDLGGVGAGLAQGSVPVVLHCILCAPFQVLGNVSPLVAHFLQSTTIMN